MESFDYIIVGGGPSGLTLAWHLNKLGKRVLVIEKDSSLGGCHRVKRVDKIFTEHGPRIYLDNYVAFMSLLEDMDLSFYDYFTPYGFSIWSMGITKYLSFREIGALAIAFIKKNDSYKDIGLIDFAEKHKFSDTAKWYLDRLCRLSDGAGIARYTLYNFIQLANQNLFYKFYQPKLPNDIGFVNAWEMKLREKGVSFMLDTSVIYIHKDRNREFLLVENNQSREIEKISAKRYILAIPPESIVKILERSNVNDMLGDYGKLVEWEKRTRYLTYLSITYHWDYEVQLPKIWGFPVSKWGVAFVVLTDDMNMKDIRSKTVISAAVSVYDVKGENGKYPNDCTEGEVIIEVFGQLKKIFGNLPKPTISLISPNVYRENDKWVSGDTAFVTTVNKYIPQETKYPEFYNCGSHNGLSDYSFTSLETAVQNAMHLINRLEPDAKLFVPDISGTVHNYILNGLLVLCFMIIVSYIL